MDLPRLDQRSALDRDANNHYHSKRESLLDGRLGEEFRVNDSKGGIQNLAFAGSFWGEAQSPGIKFESKVSGI